MIGNIAGATLLPGIPVYAGRSTSVLMVELLPDVPYSLRLEFSQTMATPTHNASGFDIDVGIDNINANATANASATATANANSNANANANANANGYAIGDADAIPTTTLFANFSAPVTGSCGNRADLRQFRAHPNASDFMVECAQKVCCAVKCNRNCQTPLPILLQALTTNANTKCSITG